jgi:hypothetical protein
MNGKVRYRATCARKMNASGDGKVEGEHCVLESENRTKGNEEVKGRRKSKFRRSRN